MPAKAGIQGLNNKSRPLGGFFICVTCGDAYLWVADPQNFRHSRESGNPGCEWYRALGARSQQLFAVPAPPAGFFGLGPSLVLALRADCVCPNSIPSNLSWLVQRQFCREQNWARKARHGWRGPKETKRKHAPERATLSRYASSSAGKPRAHIPVRPFALPLAALTLRSSPHRALANSPGAEQRASGSNTGLAGLLPAGLRYSAGAAGPEKP